MELSISKCFSSAFSHFQGQYFQEAERNYEKPDMGGTETPLSQSLAEFGNLGGHYEGLPWWFLGSCGDEKRRREVKAVEGRGRAKRQAGQSCLWEGRRRGPHGSVSMWRKVTVLVQPTQWNKGICRKHAVGLDF